MACEDWAQASCVAGCLSSSFLVFIAWEFSKSLVAMVQKSLGFVRCQKVSYFIAKATYFPLLTFLPVLDGTAVAMSVFGIRCRSAESATPSPWGCDYNDSYYSLHTYEHLTTHVWTFDGCTHIHPACESPGAVACVYTSRSGQGIKHVQQHLGLEVCGSGEESRF